MQKVLDTISNIIRDYESGEWQSAEALRKTHRDLVSNYYHLTKFNIEYFQKYNAVQYRHKGSVSSGKILAEEQVPELRIIRKIMEATDNVIWSIRSEISILKKEN